MRMRAISFLICALSAAGCGEELHDPFGHSADPLVLRAVVAEPDPEVREEAPRRAAEPEETDPAPVYSAEIQQGGSLQLVAVPIGGGGGYAPPPPAPWITEPVVYRQYVADVTSGAYGSAWSTNRDLGYHPSVISAERINGSNRYAGLWHRNDRVLNWLSQRDMTEAQYLEHWTAMDNQGFRLIDLDAYSVNGSPRFSGVWVEESQPRQYRSHRSLSLPSLIGKIDQYKADGYRPIRVNGYYNGANLRFTGLWVKDGNTDFKIGAGLTSAQYGNLAFNLAGQGYVPVDIAPYYENGQARFMGIFLRDPGVLQAVQQRDLSPALLEELNETYTKSNLVLVDIDVYPSGGSPRLSAIWHRRQARQLIQSNRPLGNDANITAMAATVQEFVTNGNDGQRGNLGFFVQDLQNGNYVTMNPHEPFYMASTSKVLIGARVAAHPEIDWADQRTLLSTDWRGESNRGFTQNNINQVQTVQTYMTNMLIGSDTASTDVLHGMLRARDGARGLDDWLRDVVGLQNVGEVTDICTVDKRISASSASCVMAMSCDTFVTFFRAGNASWNTNASEQACLASLPNDHRSLENHENYYTTLANTITPVEFGRFWRKFANGDLMPNADRAAFLATIDPSWNNGFNVFQNVAYDEFGTKNGGKRRVSTQVGIMWDWNGAVGDYTDITPRYAFALFTEDWNFDNGNDADSDGTNDDVQWARAAMRGVLNSAVAFLNAQ